MNASRTSSPFSPITANGTAYATEDWSVVIEKVGVGRWQLRDHGRRVASFETRTEALEWSERWLRGEATA